MKENNKLEICLNKFIGRCPKCEIDFDKAHFPNNYDCKDYKPVQLTTYIVKGENKNDKFRKRN